MLTANYLLHSAVNQSFFSTFPDLPYMFDTINYPEQNLLSLTISGTLEKEHYDAIIPMLEEKIARWGRINLYLDVRSFNYITATALWEDIKLDVKHWRDFNRVAITSDDSNLLKAATALATMVSPAEVHHFPLEQKEQALHWAATGETEISHSTASL